MWPTDSNAAPVINAVIMNRIITSVVNNKFSFHLGLYLMYLLDNKEDLVNLY